jgi:selenide,water dikinase
MGSNREHFAAATWLDPGVDPLLVDIGFDPQTSGGLLAAVAPEAADAVVAGLSAAGAGGAVSGHVRNGGAFRVTLLVR